MSAQTSIEAHKKQSTVETHRRDESNDTRIANPRSASNRKRIKGLFPAWPLPQSPKGWKIHNGRPTPPNTSPTIPVGSRAESTRITSSAAGDTQTIAASGLPSGSSVASGIVTRLHGVAITHDFVPLAKKRGAERQVIALPQLFCGRDSFPS